MSLKSYKNLPIATNKCLLNSEPSKQNLQVSKVLVRLLCSAMAKSRSLAKSWASDRFLAARDVKRSSVEDVKTLIHFALLSHR